MKTTILKRPGRHWGQAYLLPVVVIALLLSVVDSTFGTSVAIVGGGPTASNPSGAGYQDGFTYEEALFNTPRGLALDSTGNYLLVADENNNAIRLLDLPNDQTYTFATNSISKPIGVAVDDDGNVFALNYGNGNNGTVLEFDSWGDLLATNASGLINAGGIAIDGADNIYVTVQSNKLVKITLGGVITTIATITNAGTSLQGLVVKHNGLIAACDSGNNGIWLIDPSTTDSYSKLAGFHGAGDFTYPNDVDSPTTARFNQPYGVAEAGDGSLIVSDYGNNRVKVVLGNGVVTNLYGVSSTYWTSPWPGFYDGTVVVPDYAASPNVQARLPAGVVIAPDGSVYVSEDYYHIIRNVTGTGLTGPQSPWTPPVFNRPSGVALDGSSSDLFIADPQQGTIEKLDLGDNQTTTFLSVSNGLMNPVDVALDASNHIYVLNQGTGDNGSVLEFDLFGNLLATKATGLNDPTAFTLDGYGNLFVAGQNGQVWAFGAGISNVIATVTNAGVQLSGIALFDDGTIAVSDAGNQVLWQINPITKAVSLLTGQLDEPGQTLGSAAFAKLNSPQELARAAGDVLVVVDSGNNRLVTVDHSGAITNVLNSTNALVWFGSPGDPVDNNNVRFVPMLSPLGVAVGNGTVYASETGYNDIRGLQGTGLTPPVPGPFDVLPYFNHPSGVALNSSGDDLFIADQRNNTVEKLDLSDNQTTTFLNDSNGLANPVDVTLDASNHIYVLNQGTGDNGSVLEFDLFGNLLATKATGLISPTAFTLDDSGNILVTEQNGMVQKFSPTTSNLVATVTNAGVQLSGIALFDDGTIAVSDAGNQVLWQINPITKAVSLLTGQLDEPGQTLGSAAFAKLNSPQELARAAGDVLVVADSGNNRLVMVNRSGAITNVLNSTNALVWFGSPGDPVDNNNVRFVPMLSPVGVTVGNGTVYASETGYNDIRGLQQTGLTPPPPPPTPPTPATPVIGVVSFPAPNLLSVLTPVTSSVYNNDVLIAIQGTNGTQTFYTSGITGNVPSPSSTNGSTAPFYEDGLSSMSDLDVQGYPDMTIKAVNVNGDGISSSITSARFQFKVANPTINGDNAAHFVIGDATTNAVFYYTIDGTDPTNTPDELLANNNSSLTNAISLNISSNVTFKVRAFRDNYLPSATVSTTFSPSNFVPNSISFGFASGEASSDFIASPGQTFYAPITLTTLPNAEIYSLQFNVTVTNAGPNPGPSIAPGAFSFQSMLLKPLTNNLYTPIPPYMFIADASSPPSPGQIISYQGTNFVDLETTNLSENLLGVGWLERAGQTNLYNTLSQTLITYSQAHDDLFPNGQDPNGVIVGGYEFQVPETATLGQTYQIQIGRPSATDDGVGAPGSDVYIAAPTGGSLTNGAINSVKIVTMGQRKYLVGDAYPFRWFNAGDFGDSNLDNADAEQVFEAAVYKLNSPAFQAPGSDFFDAMDSCGTNLAYYDSATGYYTNAPGAASLNALFSGNDTTINNMAYGDGQLNVCDVYVTYRRSLDPGLNWFARFWDNGVRVAESVPNATPTTLVKTQTDNKPVVPNVTSTNAPQVNFSASNIVAAAGQQVQIPISAQIFGAYPLRVLMLNLSVDPLDGSPNLTTAIQFTPNPNLGTPTYTDSTGDNNYAAVWLNSSIAGLTGDAIIGTLTVTIPANTTSTAAYAIHFDHASASPNGIASFPEQTLTGLVTLSSRTNSCYGDGIPDWWRLVYFGTTNNLLSVSNACPSGDGVDNWQKYVAGVDPNVPDDFPSLNAKTPVPSGDTAAIHWQTVSGKKYVILRSDTLFPGQWTAIATNTGTGTDMEFDDNSSGSTRFYRVQILP